LTRVAAPGACEHRVQHEHRIALAGDVSYGIPWRSDVTGREIIEPSSGDHTRDLAEA